MNTTTSKIIVVILNVNKDRRIFMESQLEKIKLPFDVYFFQGSTQETEKLFLELKPQNYPVTSNNMICCFRSYARLFYEYTTNKKEYDYLLTLEDDVIFHKDFVQSIYDIVDEWKKDTTNDIEYINLGYLNIAQPDFSQSKNIKSINLYVENLPSNWGTQAMLFIPKTVNKLSKLNLETFQQTDEYLKTFLAVFRHRIIFLQADSIFPTICKQALIYPPIAIESPELNSTIYENQPNSARSKKPIDFL